MNIEFLSSHPNSVPVVADWIFDEWGRRKPGVTREQMLATIRSETLDDDLPVSLVAIADYQTVAFASLRPHELVEVYPDSGPWIGRVFVAPSFRGNGIATELCRRLEEIARSRGLSEVFLQTERHDGGLYARIGYQPIARLQHDGFDVVVMQKVL